MTPDATSVVTAVRAVLTAQEVWQGTATELLHALAAADGTLALPDNARAMALATRGSPTRLAMDVAQLLVAPVGEHSQKPEEVRGRIQRLLPTSSYLLAGRPMGGLSMARGISAFCESRPPWERNG